MLTVMNQLELFSLTYILHYNNIIVYIKGGGMYILIITRNEVEEG
jgi:hypothetical protein